MEILREYLKVINTGVNVLVKDDFVSQSNERVSRYNVLRK